MNKLARFQSSSHALRTWLFQAGVSLSIVGSAVNFAGAAENATAASTRIEQGRTEASAVFSKASPSVVLVRNKMGVQAVQGSGVAFRHQADTSTGEIFSWVATNAHVVKDGKGEITVEQSGNVYRASVKYIDTTFDLALLAVPKKRLPLVRFAELTSLYVGARVYAIGSPLGFENSLTEGIVSGRRTLEGIRVIQTSAAISKGNSGGGLFDASARLVGITTSKAIGGENLNFAVESTYVELASKAVFAADMLRVVSKQVENLSSEVATAVGSPVLVRWLMTSTASDGELFVHKALQLTDKFMAGSRSPKNLDTLYVGLADLLRQYSAAVNRGEVKANGDPSASAYTVVCRLRSELDQAPMRDHVLRIDPDRETVNGNKADFTDTHIHFAESKAGQFRSTLNRYTGSIHISASDLSAFAVGSCTKTAERKF